MLGEAYEFCKGFDSAVCAGAGVGVIPNQLAEKFSVVYAFEPEAINFTHLALNAHSNVVKFQAALGNTMGPMGFTGDLHDLGSWQIQAGGKTPMIRLDSFNLAPDLVYLDVNGFEPQAITGAEKMLKARKPVLVIAKSEKLSDYGNTINFMLRALKELGYEVKKDTDKRMICVSASLSS